MTPFFSLIEENSMPERFALYFAPEEGSELASFGRHWFAPEANSGPPTFPAPALHPETILSLTAKPRHYGFHATLKPPFQLRPHMPRAALFDRLSQFCAQRQSIIAPPLHPCCLGSFIALRFSRQCPEVDDLAAQCVRLFDDFRLPPGNEELQRRRAHRLSNRQELLLRQWGYPYVLDEFRFHLTLTQPLADERQRQAMLGLLQQLTAPFRQLPTNIFSIALFHQTDTSRPFSLLHRFPFQPHGDQMKAQRKYNLKLTPL